MLSVAILAVSAATAVPSEIVLSRTDAEAMSSEQLVALLLANFPHGEITEVRLPDIGPGPHGEWTDPSLGYIAFEERGKADGGRLCRSRTITTTFEWPDGGLGKPYKERSSGDPKRLFRVVDRPNVAVLDGDATDALCASLPAEGYGALSPQPEHEQRLRQFIAITEAFHAGQELAVTPQCGDWRGVDEKPCDYQEALAKIDWEEMLFVRETDWPHGVPATRLTFSPADGPLVHVYLAGHEKIEAVKLTYAWPAPF